MRVDLLSLARALPRTDLERVFSPSWVVGVALFCFFCCRGLEGGVVVVVFFFFGWEGVHVSPGSDFLYRFFFSP